MDPSYAVQYIARCACGLSTISLAKIQEVVDLVGVCLTCTNAYLSSWEAFNKQCVVAEVAAC